MNGRYVDPDSANVLPVQGLEQRIRRGFFDVDDPAAGIAHLRHRLELAVVVAQVGTGLHEHEALDADPARPLQIILKRRNRRLVAQFRVAVGKSLRIAEHMKVAVAGECRRAHQGFDGFIHDVRSVAHSAFTPARSITCFQSVSSRRMRSVKSAPSIRTARAPCESRKALTFGC